MIFLIQGSRIWQLEDHSLLVLQLEVEGGQPRHQDWTVELILFAVAILLPYLLWLLTCPWNGNKNLDTLNLLRLEGQDPACTQTFRLHDLLPFLLYCPNHFINFFCNSICPKISSIF